MFRLALFLINKQFLKDTKLFVLLLILTVSLMLAKNTIANELINANKLKKVIAQVL